MSVGIDTETGSICNSNSQNDGHALRRTPQKSRAHAVVVPERRRTGFNCKGGCPPGVHNKHDHPRVCKCCFSVCLDASFKSQLYEAPEPVPVGKVQSVTEIEANVCACGYLYSCILQAMLPFFDGTGTAGFASTAPVKQNNQDTKRTSCKAVERGLLFSFKRLLTECPVSK